ncbi:MAG TPA: carboxypeptidase regulatory-like domain-containing protein [Bryobacteraceae bacterium]|nr:carboxypeptidase regulatory-like domain-containing protein [Bryobacteraceae bacterium]
MKRYLLALVIFPAALCAQDNTSLPVKRVVLYKNGVGYFEHVGQVRDKQDVTIRFTSGQLNDVLKSLTVLDLDGGRITGVAYGSSAPIDRQLGDLHLPSGDHTSLSDFLGGLRGARLEIHSGATVIAGRLLSVERKARVSNGTTEAVDSVSLLTDSGELRTAEIGPGFSVKMLDKDLAAKVEHLLDIVSAGREADVRSMVISTDGAGSRSLFVSYISEVPVWKSTYRLVLGSKNGQKPLLQGWAIVDNTVGEDWNNVQLSLVAGAPQSFVENLSQPYYTRRPVVGLPENATMTPQTHESTLTPGGGVLSGRVIDGAGNPVINAAVRAYDSNSRLAAETRTDTGGDYEFGSLPDGAVRLDVEAAGFQRMSVAGVGPVRQDVTMQVGSASQTVTVVGRAAATLDTMTATLTPGIMNGRSAGTGGALGSGAMLGSGAQTELSKRSPGRGVGSGYGGGIGAGSFMPAAVPKELGDLFEYKLKDPISIPKNRSSLVPIVQAEMAAEKVSLWNDTAGLPRPQRALWLTNSSGNTLDGGSFSVMEEETFAGEGIFDPIRPGEKRLVTYALDLALNASSKNSVESQRVTHIVIGEGLMKQTSELVEKKTYTFRNEDTSARTVIVEHPVRRGYELRGSTRPDETTADWIRFRLHVDPKQTATLVVEEARPLVTSYQITNIDDRQMEIFMQERSIDKSIEGALRKILVQKNAIAALDSEKEARSEEMTKIFDDQQRLRENMKALKGSAEEKVLLQRYTQQLNDQETQLDTLRKQVAQLAQQSDSAQEALDKSIAGLSFDVKL